MAENEGAGSGEALGEAVIELAVDTQGVEESLGQIEASLRDVVEQQYQIDLLINPAFRQELAAVSQQLKSMQHHAGAPGGAPALRSLFTQTGPGSFAHVLQNSMARAMAQSPLVARSVANAASQDMRGVTRAIGGLERSINALDEVRREPISAQTSASSVTQAPQRVIRYSEPSSEDRRNDSVRKLTDNPKAGGEIAALLGGTSAPGHATSRGPSDYRFKSSGASQGGAETHSPVPSYVSTMRAPAAVPINLFSAGTIDQKTTDSFLPDQWQEALAVYREVKRGKGTIAAFDTETYGLFGKDRTAAQLGLAIVGKSGGTKRSQWIKNDKPLPSRLGQLFGWSKQTLDMPTIGFAPGTVQEDMHGITHDTKAFIAHNAKFDVEALANAGIHMPAQAKIIDTQKLGEQMFPGEVWKNIISSYIPDDAEQYDEKTKTYQKLGPRSLEGLTHFLIGSGLANPKHFAGTGFGPNETGQTHLADDDALLAMRVFQSMAAIAESGQVFIEGPESAAQSRGTNRAAGVTSYAMAQGSFTRASGAAGKDTNPRRPRANAPAAATPAAAQPAEAGITQKGPSEPAAPVGGTDAGHTEFSPKTFGLFAGRMARAEREGTKNSEEGVPGDSLYAGSFATRIVYDAARDLGDDRLRTVVDMRADHENPKTSLEDLSWTRQREAAALLQWLAPSGQLSEIGTFGPVDQKSKQRSFSLRGNAQKLADALDLRSGPGEGPAMLLSVLDRRLGGVLDLGEGNQSGDETLPASTHKLLVGAAKYGASFAALTSDPARNTDVITPGTDDDVITPGADDKVRHETAYQQTTFAPEVISAFRPLPEANQLHEAYDVNGNPIVEHDTDHRGRRAVGSGSQPDSAGEADPASAAPTTQSAPRQPTAIASPNPPSGASAPPPSEPPPPDLHATQGSGEPLPIPLIGVGATPLPTFTLDEYLKGRQLPVMDTTAHRVEDPLTGETYFVNQKQKDDLDKRLEAVKKTIADGWASKEDRDLLDDLYARQKNATATARALGNRQKELADIQASSKSKRSKAITEAKNAVKAAEKSAKEAADAFTSKDESKLTSLQNKRRKFVASSEYREALAEGQSRALRSFVRDNDLSTSRSAASVAVPVLDAAGQPQMERRGGVLAVIKEVESGPEYKGQLGDQADARRRRRDMVSRGGDENPFVKRIEETKKTIVSLHQELAGIHADASLSPEDKQLQVKEKQQQIAQAHAQLKQDQQAVVTQQARAGTKLTVSDSSSLIEPESATVTRFESDADAQANSARMGINQHRQERAGLMSGRYLMSPAEAEQAYIDRAGLNPDATVMEKAAKLRKTLEKRFGGKDIDLSGVAKLASRGLFHGISRIQDGSFILTPDTDELRGKKTYMVGSQRAEKVSPDEMATAVMRQMGLPDDAIELVLDRGRVIGSLISRANDDATQHQTAYLSEVSVNEDGSEFFKYESLEAGNDALTRYARDLARDPQRKAMSHLDLQKETLGLLDQGIQERHQSLIANPAHPMYAERQKAYEEFLQAPEGSSDAARAKLASVDAGMLQGAFSFFEPPKKKGKELRKHERKVAEWKKQYANTPEGKQFLDDRDALARMIPRADKLRTSIPAQERVFATMQANDAASMQAARDLQEQQRRASDPMYRAAREAEEKEFATPGVKQLYEDLDRVLVGRPEWVNQIGRPVPHLVGSDGIAPLSEKIGRFLRPIRNAGPMSLEEGIRAELSKPGGLFEFYNKRRGGFLEEYTVTPEGVNPHTGQPLQPYKMKRWVPSKPRIDPQTIKLGPNLYNEVSPLLAEHVMRLLDPVQQDDTLQEWLADKAQVANDPGLMDVVQQMLMVGQQADLATLYGQPGTEQSASMEQAVRDRLKLLLEGQGGVYDRLNLRGAKERSMNGLRQASPYIHTVLNGLLETYGGKDRAEVAETRGEMFRRLSDEKMDELERQSFPKPGIIQTNVEGRRKRRRVRNLNAERMSDPVKRAYGRFSNMSHHATQYKPYGQFDPDRSKPLSDEELKAERFYTPSDFIGPVPSPENVDGLVIQLGVDGPAMQSLAEAYARVDITGRVDTNFTDFEQEMVESVDPTYIVDPTTGRTRQRRTKKGLEPIRRNTLRHQEGIRDTTKIVAARSRTVGSFTVADLFDMRAVAQARLDAREKEFAGPIAETKRQLDLLREERALIDDAEQRGSASPESISHDRKRVLGTESKLRAHLDDMTGRLTMHRMHVGRLNRAVDSAMALPEFAGLQQQAYDSLKAGAALPWSSSHNAAMFAARELAAEQLERRSAQTRERDLNRQGNVGQEAVTELVEHIGKTIAGPRFRPHVNMAALAVAQAQTQQEREEALQRLADIQEGRAQPQMQLRVPTPQEMQDLDEAQAAGLIQGKGYRTNTATAGEIRMTLGKDPSWKPRKYTEEEFVQAQQDRDRGLSPFNSPDGIRQRSALWDDDELVNDQIKHAAETRNPAVADVDDVTAPFVQNEPTPSGLQASEAFTKATGRVAPLADIDPRPLTVDSPELTAEQKVETRKIQIEPPSGPVNAPHQPAVVVTPRDAVPTAGTCLVDGCGFQAPNALALAQHTAQNHKPEDLANIGYQPGPAHNAPAPAVTQAPPAAAPVSLAAPAAPSQNNAPTPVTGWGIASPVNAPGKTAGGAGAAGGGRSGFGGSQSLGGSVPVFVTNSSPIQVSIAGGSGSGGTGSATGGATNLSPFDPQHQVNAQADATALYDRGYFYDEVQSSLGRVYDPTVARRAAKDAWLGKVQAKVPGSAFALGKDGLPVRMRDLEREEYEKILRQINPAMLPEEQQNAAVGAPTAKSSVFGTLPLWFTGGQTSAIRSNTITYSEPSPYDWAQTNEPVEAKGRDTSAYGPDAAARERAREANAQARMNGQLPEPQESAAEQAAAAAAEREAARNAWGDRKSITEAYYGGAPDPLLDDPYSPDKPPPVTSGPVVLNMRERHGAWDPDGVLYGAMPQPVAASTGPYSDPGPGAWTDDQSVAAAHMGFGVAPATEPEPSPAAQQRSVSQIPDANPDLPAPSEWRREDMPDDDIRQPWNGAGDRLGPPGAGWDPRLEPEDWKGPGSQLGPPGAGWDPQPPIGAPIGAPVKGKGWDPKDSALPFPYSPDRLEARPGGTYSVEEVAAHYLPHNPMREGDIGVIITAQAQEQIAAIAAAGGDIEQTMLAFGRDFAHAGGGIVRIIEGVVPVESTPSTNNNTGAAQVSVAPEALAAARHQITQMGPGYRDAGVIHTHPSGNAAFSNQDISEFESTVGALKAAGTKDADQPGYIQAIATRDGIVNIVQKIRGIWANDLTTNRTSQKIGVESRSSRNTSVTEGVSFGGSSRDPRLGPGLADSDAQDNNVPGPFTLDHGPILPEGYQQARRDPKTGELLTPEQNYRRDLEIRRLSVGVRRSGSLPVAMRALTEELHDMGNSVNMLSWDPPRDEQMYEAQGYRAAMIQAQIASQRVKRNFPARALSTTPIQLFENKFGGMYRDSKTLRAMHPEQQMQRLVNLDLSKAEDRKIWREMGPGQRAALLDEARMTHGQLGRERGRLQRTFDERQQALRNMAPQVQRLRGLKAYYDLVARSQATEVGNPFAQPRNLMPEHERDAWEKMEAAFGALTKSSKEAADALDLNSKEQEKSAKRLSDMQGDLAGKSDVLRNLGAGFVGGIVGAFAMQGMNMVVQGAAAVIEKAVVPVFDRLTGNALVANQQGMIMGQATTQARGSRLGVLGVLGEAGFSGDSTSDEFIEVLAAEGGGRYGTQQSKERMDATIAAIRLNAESASMGLLPGFAPSMFRSRGAILSGGPGQMLPGLGFGWAIGGEPSANENLRIMLDEAKSESISEPQLMLDGMRAGENADLASQIIAAGVDLLPGDNQLPKGAPSWEMAQSPGAIKKLNKLLSNTFPNAPQFESFNTPEAQSALETLPELAFLEMADIFRSRGELATELLAEKKDADGNVIDQFNNLTDKERRKAINQGFVDENGNVDMSQLEAARRYSAMMLFQETNRGILGDTASFADAEANRQFVRDSVRAGTKGQMQLAHSQEERLAQQKQIAMIESLPETDARRKFLDDAGVVNLLRTTSSYFTEDPANIDELIASYKKTLVGGYETSFALKTAMEKMIPDMLYKMSEQFGIQTRGEQAGFALQMLNNPIIPFGTGIYGGGKLPVPGLGNISKDARQLNRASIAQQREDMAVTRQMIETVGEQFDGRTTSLGIKIDSTEATHALDELVKLRKTTVELNEAAANIQLGRMMREYTHNVFLARRQVADLSTLVGKSNSSELGQLERKNLLATRTLQLMQLEDQQRQLNYTRALAGFTYEGATPEEAALRYRIGQLQTERQQKELDISKGITKREFKIVDIQNARALQEAIWQLGNITKSFNEDTALATINQNLAAVGRRQQRLNAEVNRYIGLAQTWEGGVLEFSQTIADETFKTIEEVATDASNALIEAAKRWREYLDVSPDTKDEPDNPNNPTDPDKRTPPKKNTESPEPLVDPLLPPTNKPQNKKDTAGAVGVLGVAGFAVDEPSGEDLAVRKKARRKAREMAEALGQMGQNITININASVRNDHDIIDIARQVEKVLNRRAAVLGVRRV